MNDTIEVVATKWRDINRDPMFANRTADGTYMPLSPKMAHHPTSLFMSMATDLDETNPVADKIFLSLRGKQLIELGSGRSPAYAFWDYGPSKIHLVDPTLIPITQYSEHVQIDSPRILRHVNHGLAFLRSFKDEAVVISGAMIQDCILDENYTRALAREIYRVTPRGSFTMHLTNEDFFLPAFTSAGFTLVDKLNPVNWKSQPTKPFFLDSSGEYVILKK